MRASARWLAGLLVLLVLAVPARGDDVGLISARLIEDAGPTYVLEVEVPPSLVGAVAPPVLPERFGPQAKPDYEPRGSLISVRYGFGSGEPLRLDDVLLLPWARTGVLLEARWLDGSRQSALFLARVDGIPVAIRTLRPETPSAAAALGASVRAGAIHVITGAAHWILIVAVLVLVPARSTRLIFALVYGYAAGLVVADLGMPAPSPLLAGGCLLVAATLAARSALVRGSAPEGARRFVPVLVLAGAVDGMSATAVMATEGHAALEAAAFVVGAGTVVLAASGLLSTGAAVWRVRRGEVVTARSAAALAAGSAAVAGIVGIVATAATTIPVVAVDPGRFMLQRGAAAMGGASGRAAAAPRELTHPLMLFLTVEPFEVRCEILAAAGLVVEQLDVSMARDDLIEVGEQAAVRTAALEAFAATMEIVIDGRPARPNVRSIDFLTLGAGGAATREEPVPEPIDTAILGATFVFATPSIAERLALQWEGRSGGLPVPVTLTDPDGVEGAALSEATPLVEWTNDLIGFTVPEVQPVAVTRPTWGAGSLVLLVLGAGLFQLAMRSGARRRAATAIGACTLAAVLLHPLVRVPAPFGPAIPRDAAAATLEGLLTNVYRSFGFRDESAIYDALAVSVAGEQLTDVYIEHRRSLELENRGGARARVDAVDVTDVVDVRRDGDGGLVIEASWTVSGSVNHFGHTHYRRNRSAARFGLRAIEGVWKITQIEVLEETREL